MMNLTCHKDGSPERLALLLERETARPLERDGLARLPEREWLARLPEREWLARLPEREAFSRAMSI